MENIPIWIPRHTQTHSHSHTYGVYNANIFRTLHRIHSWATQKSFAFDLPPKIKSILHFSHYSRARIIQFWTRNQVHKWSFVGAIVVWPSIQQLEIILIMLPNWTKTLSIVCLWVCVCMDGQTQHGSQKQSMWNFKYFEERFMSRWIVCNRLQCPMNKYTVAINGFGSVFNDRFSVSHFLSVL